MKNNLKILILLLTVVLFSCSPDDKGAVGNPNDNTTIIAKPMQLNIDSQAPLDLRNTEGNSESVLTGTTGSYTHLLFGYYDSGEVARMIPIQQKRVEVSLFIPSSLITVGDHLFSNSQQNNSYFGKINLLKINDITETVTTTNGKITIISYNSVTKLLKGTFQITTNDGTNQNHQFTGSFEYILTE
jgi:hypothetical protein